MLCLAIHCYKRGAESPTSSVRVPLAVVSMVAKFVPRAVLAKLEHNGVQIGEMVRHAATELEPGILVDIIEAEKQERVVVAIEHMPAERSRQIPADRDTTA